MHHASLSAETQLAASRAKLHPRAHAEREQHALHSLEIYRSVASP